MKYFVLFLWTVSLCAFSKEKPKDQKQVDYIKINQKQLVLEQAPKVTSTMESVQINLSSQYPELLTNPEKYEGLFYFLLHRTNINIKAKFLLSNANILQLNEKIYNDLLKDLSEKKKYEQYWFSILDRFIENTYNASQITDLQKDTPKKYKSIIEGQKELISFLKKKLELPNDLLKLQLDATELTNENIQTILNTKGHLGVTSSQQIIKILETQMTVSAQEQSFIYAHNILVLDEKNIKSLEYLSNYYRNQKNAVSSSFYLKKLYELDTKYAYNLAISLKQSGDLTLAHTVISKEKPNPANLRLKYEIELELGNLQEATKTLTDLYQIMPSTDNKILLSNQLYREAQNDFNNSQFQSSINKLKQSIKLVPTARAYNLLGDIYKQTLTQQENSILAYKNTYDLQPTTNNREKLNENLHLYLKNNIVDQNWIKNFNMLTDIETARQYYKKIINTKDLSKENREQIADKYYQLFKNLNYKNDLHRAIEKNLIILPNHKLSISLQANLFSLEKEYDRAYDNYKNLVSNYKSYHNELVNTSMLIAKSYIEDDETEKAIKITEETLQLVPNNKTLIKFLELNKKQPINEPSILAENKITNEPPPTAKKDPKQKVVKNKNLITQAYIDYYDLKYREAYENLNKGLESEKRKEKDTLLLSLLTIKTVPQNNILAISMWKNVKIDKLKKEVPYNDTFYILLDLSESLKPLNESESFRAIKAAIQFSPVKLSKREKEKLDEVAKFNFENKQYTSSFALYNKLVSLEPSNSMYSINLGISAYHRKTYLVAIAILSPINEAPTDILISSYINQAFLEFSKNNKSQSQVYLDKAEKLGATEDDFKKLNIQAGQSKKEEWYEFIKSENSVKADSLTENLDKLEILSEKDPSSAIDTLLKLEQSNPNNVYIYNLLAKSYLRNYNWDSAWEYSTLSAKVDNSVSNKKILQTINQNIAFQALNNNDTNIAWKSISSSLNTSPNDPYSLLIAGDIQYAQFNILDARNYWMKANAAIGKSMPSLEQKIFKTNFIDSYPKKLDDQIKKIEKDRLPSPTPEQKIYFSQIYSAKGDELFNEKNQTEAKTKYTDALTYNDRNQNALEGIVNVYTNEKDWRYCIFYLQKAIRITTNKDDIIKLSKKISNIYVNYSDDLMNKGQQIDAKLMLEQAVKANPQNNEAVEKLSKL